MHKSVVLHHHRRFLPMKEDEEGRFQQFIIDISVLGDILRGQTLIKKKTTGPIINTDIFVQLQTARYMQFAIYILPPHATELRFHYLTVFEFLFFVICSNNANLWPKLSVSLHRKRGENGSVVLHETSIPSSLRLRLRLRFIH